MLRAAGGRTKAEIEAEKVEPTATSGIGQQAADRVRKPRGAITGSFTEGESFFKKVNALAMASLSSWVPALFPTANPYNGGYRVTSKDLGRNYQEDLSISPKGIKDWGVWDVGDSHQGKRTPIDLVIEWGNKTATDAALWLCDRMGMPPEALGWRQSSQDEEAPGEAEGERPANEAALSNNLPVIQIKDGELSSLATKAEEILIAAGVPIYQRGGTLVRPIIDTVDATRGRTTKVAQLKVLDAVYLRDLLGRYAVWVRWDARSKKMVQTNPPLEIANTILAR